MATHKHRQKLKQIHIKLELKERLKSRENVYLHCSSKLMAWIAIAQKSTMVGERGRMGVLECLDVSSLNSSLNQMIRGNPKISTKVTYIGFLQSCPHLTGRPKEAKTLEAHVLQCGTHWFYLHGFNKIWGFEFIFN